ncbi:MAG: glycosyltransferase family 4 protein [Dinghuibacter sp.]|nr:glycosyltransferase family 4 protein [Dinghuibacter sp.]
MKKTILVLTDWYAPAYKAGGIITACVNFAEKMSQTHKVFILTSDSDMNGEKLEGISTGVWTMQHPNCFVKYLPAEQMSSGEIQQTVKALNPESVHLNSMFSLRYALLPLWLLLMKKIKCPVYLSTHGMMLPGALQQKSFKKKIFLTLFKLARLQHKVILRTNMDEEYEHIKKILRPSAANLEKEVQPLGASDYEYTCNEKAPGFVSLAFLGRVHPVKNLSFALDVLSQVPYDVEFKIIGAIEDAAYWNQCRTQVEQLPQNIRVKHYGALPQKQAEQLLKETHALFLPSQTENFCFAIYESFSNGRPVITSNKTPWRNLEAQGVGWDIALNSRDQFVDAIEKLAMMGEGEYTRLSENAWAFANRYRKNITIQSQLEKAVPQLFPAVAVKEAV